MLIKFLNTLFLVVSCFSLVVMFHHMTAKTRMSIRLGSLIAFVGSLAQGIGIWLPTWDRWADTLLFGGIAMLLVANIRKPIAIFCEGVDQEKIQKVADRSALILGGITVTAVLAVWSVM